MKRFLSSIGTMHRWCCVLTVMLLMLLCAVPAWAEKRASFEKDITIKFYPDTNDCTKCRARIYLLYAHRDDDGAFDAGFRRESDDDDEYGAHVFIEYLKPGHLPEKPQKEFKEFAYLFFPYDEAAVALQVDTTHFGQSGLGNRNLYYEFVEETGFQLDSMSWYMPECVGVKPLKKHSDTGCDEMHYYYIYFEFTLPVYYLNYTIKAYVKGKWWKWGTAYAWMDDDTDCDSGDYTLNYTWKLGKLQNGRVKVDSDGNLWSKCEYVKGNCANFVTGKRVVAPEINKNDTTKFAIGAYSLLTDKDWTKVGEPNFIRWKDSGYDITYYGDLADSIPHIVRPDTTLMYLCSPPDQISTSVRYYGYPVVTQVNTTFNAEKKSIDVSWQYNGKTDLDYIANGHWIIERYVEGQNDGKFKVLDDPLPLNQTTYKDLAIDFKKKYKYKIYYRHNDWKADSKNIEKLTKDDTGKTDDLKCMSTEVQTNREIEGSIKTGKQQKDRVKLTLSWQKGTSDGLYNVALYRDDLSAPLKEWKNLDMETTTSEYEDISSYPDNVLSYHYGHTYTMKVTANRPSANKDDILCEKSISGTVSGGNAISNVTASQGDYTDRILLNWETMRALSDAKPDTYRVKRQLLKRDVVTGSDGYEVVLNNYSSIDRYLSFSDETALPGEYYRYRVEILGDDGKPMESVETVGFVKSSGAISGNVTYQDGTALANARVNLKALSTDTDRLFTTFQRSVLMRGDTLAIQLSNKDYADIMKDYTIQFWYRGTDVQNTWKHVTIAGSKILLGEYNFIANGLDTKEVSNNDLLVKPTLVDSIRQIQIAGFEGNIDELQIWKRQLTSDEVARYATMRLSGKESGLVAYYPFDEGLPGYAFNHAYDGNKRSKVMAILGQSISPDTNVPNSVEFCTYTDALGSYLFSDVPFEENGSLYAVSPVYGEHDFEPVRIQRYISPSTLVYSGVDFEDQSSFIVQGTVTYRYGDFPVEGASIYVDGKQAMRNEKPILTDVEGRYHLEMPVGYHSIRVVMKDHGFADDGRFPAGEGATYDFQQPMYVNFVDTTTVSVAGRVAGGHSMAHLTLAAHNDGGSRANIGKATLYLAPLSNRNYTVNVSESEPVIMPQGDAAIESVTTLLPYERNGHQPGQIKIETDPATGEFCALLPPLKYKVVRGETKSVTNEQLRAFDAPQINPIVGKTYTDEWAKPIKIEGKDTTEIIKFTYNSKVIIQYDTRPTLDITQERSDETDKNKRFALGEEYLLTDDDITIPAFQKITSTIYDYTLKDSLDNTYPVFYSGNDYTLTLHAYQEFENLDDENDPQLTEVPLSGSTLNIRNFGWGLPSSNSVKFNNDGEASFIFRASAPILSSANLADKGLHVQGMTLAVSTGTRTYVFPERGTTDAVFMGKVLNQGSMVLAEGPDIIEFVLRDPPGSESFSTIEEGSSYSYKFTSMTKDKSQGGFKHDMNVIAGGAKDGGVGNGASYAKAECGTFEAHVLGNFEWGTNFTSSHQEVQTDGTTNTVSFTQKISTGSDPAHVGSRGDLYIGSTIFHYFGNGDSYLMHSGAPKAGVSSFKLDYKDRKTQKTTTLYLYPDETYCTGSTLGGRFIYSQQYLQEVLIPGWTRERNLRLWPKGTKSENFVWKKDEVVRFISKYDPDEFSYGGNDSYDIVQNPGSSNENYRDSIQMFNNWISSWKDAISANEYRKAEANYSINKSISNGVSYTESQTSSMTNSIRLDSLYVNETIGQSGIHGDLILNKSFQFRISTNIMGTYGGTHTYDSDSTKTWVNNTTISYTLQDNDIHDYLYVKIDTTSFQTEGYRFYLGGGATTRPWEGPEKTLYYNAGMSYLSDGTLMVDKPRMSIKNRVVTDVPNGRETSIELQLGNASEIHAAASYRLFLDDATNPDGLQITCDGYPITGDGHLLNFRADESYTKVLKIRQSRLDVMDYKDVGLFFHAPTYQYFESKNPDINPKLTFSVHYKPSCSDVSLSAFDQWQNKILAVNLGTDSKVVLRASDFNRDYNGFYKLAIERKGEYETQWTPIHVWAVDSAAIERNPDLRGMEVIDSSSVSYLYDMAPLADQTYMFRAVTHGKYGTKEVTFEGDTITIVKDMKAPQVMAFTPTNGILTADDDISVLFNEDVLSTGIVSSNIKVTGVLNEHELTHQDGIRFSSSQSEPVHTTADVSFSGSFSIEMWISEGSQSQDEIFSHGQNGLKFGFDNQKRFWVNDPTKHVSDIRVNPSKWSYLSVGVDDDKTLHAYMFYTDTRGVTHQDELLTIPNFEYNARGHIYIGKKLEGMISGLTLWNKYRDMTDMADRSKSHTGRESGLVAYWPMDEGHGLIAADKVGGRHLAVPSADRWYVSSGNYAAHFDKDKKSYIHTGAISIGDDEDYSLEFWFSTVPGKTGDKATLLDMGNGRICLIGGKLCYQPKEGTARQLVSESSDDGDWHHFALRVQRGTSASAFYDGKFSMFAEEGLIGSMNVDAMTIGAHCINPQTKEYAEYLTGGIDELRIWRANLSSQSLLANQYAHIDSTAAGLVMNYSFNHNYYRQQTQSWGVQGDTNDHSIYQLPNEANNVTTSSQAPSLTAVALEEPVAFDWVANKEKVVLTITEPAQRIEGCTLNFSIDRVRDMNGNTLTAPVKWSAFVNLNRLVWSQSDAELQTVYGGQQASVTVDARNNGSELEDWHLEDIPSWLICSQERGTLTPQTYTHIKFTTREGTPIGYYEAIVYLTGNNGVREPLRITLTVTGEAPDWSVDPSLYEFSDNLTATLKIGGFISEDKYDMVAAFVDGNCVGLAHPFYVEALDNYLVMMTLYSNKEMTGKPVCFKAWRASTGMIHPVVELYNNNGVLSKAVLSQENLVYGTPVSPWLLDATEDQENRLDLAQGWNWISLNLYSNDEDMKLQNLFGNCSMSYIKSQDYFAMLDGDGNWVGSTPLISNPLSPKKMYAVVNDQTQTLTLSGKPVKSANWPIDLRTGWNWIGYTPQVPLDLITALAGADPQEGDMVKGQRLFAYYTQKQWVGTMEYMEPGQGYLYRSVSPETKEMFYPDSYNTVYRSKPKAAPRQAAPGEPQWEWNPYAYSGNMTVTALVTLDGEPINSGMVGAFDANGICRGYQTIDPDNGMLYLLISGDEVCNLSLRLWDAQTGKLYEMEAPFSFASNQIIGHINTPYQLQFVDPTGIRRNAGDNDDDELRFDLSGRHADQHAKGIIVTTGKKQLVK